MDNLRDLLCIRRMDSMLKGQIRVFYGVMRRVDERIEESVLRWLSHIDKLGNDGIAKRLSICG